MAIDLLRKFGAGIRRRTNSSSGSITVSTDDASTPSNVFCIDRKPTLRCCQSTYSLVGQPNSGSRNPDVQPFYDYGIATASDAPPGSSYKSSDDYSGESFLRCSTSDDGQHGDHSFLDFDHAPHKDDDRGTAKVLLLGRSGSGKSTFLKQLSLLYGAHEEQQSARRACQISIYLEIIQMLQYTLANSNDLHATALCRIRLAPVLSLQNQLEARLVETRLDERGSRSPPYGAFEIIPHIFSALKNEIQAAMESMSPLDKLRPVWAHLLRHQSRMLSSRFQPNEDDIVRIHLPVHGVEERLVQTPEALPIRVCDVANSQRNVSVWSRFFEDADCIIYFIDTSSFDVVADDISSELEAAFDQLEVVCRYPALRSVDVCVFLNKTDLLKRKIRSGSRLSHYCPDYRGRDGSVRGALAYMRSRMDTIASRDIDQADERHRSITRRMYSHVLQTADIDQVGLAFQALQDSIDKRRNEAMLGSYGL
ncbi:hypothetical protein EMMF5_000033 [Cystobasidiomycetes sp. EMM_F5]